MQYVIDPDHPALPGHFPGQPVVPGVVILSLVLDDVAAAAKPLRVVGIRRVKFLRRLLPGESLRVEAGPPQSGKLAFKCWVQDYLLAEGQAILAT
jgi:3-hydroxymyristoyl/3-hydroxydecanoyl-(acyl carrier protein) dehydratase